MNKTATQAKSRPFEQYLYHFGFRAKMPFSALKTIDEGVDFLRNPSDYRLRRRLAKDIVGTSEWSNFLPADKGLALLSPDTLPAINNVLATAEEIRTHNLDLLQYDSKERAPFRDLITAKDLDRWPALIDFALSPQLVEAVTAYLGTVPRLCGVNLWYSQGNTNMVKGSGLWHLDKPEVNFVQCFVLLHDVKPENGPLTVLDAAQTETICRNTDYMERSYLGNGRMADEEVYRFFKDEDFARLQGKAGTAALCDTSRCLHYGGRCVEGYRWMANFQYAPAHRVMDHPRRDYRRFVTEDTSQINKLLLTGGTAVPRGWPSIGAYD